MPQLTEDQKSTTRPCKSSWNTFLRRLAFWKAAKQEKLDKMFIEAVNDLGPDWERQRLERAATKAAVRN